MRIQLQHLLTRFKPNNFTLIYPARIKKPATGQHDSWKVVSFRGHNWRRAKFPRLLQFPLHSATSGPVLTRLVVTSRCFVEDTVRNYSKMTEKKVFSRLPKDVIPSNYKLRLKPDLAAFTFEGHEDITVEVKKSTDFVILNCADIKVQKATYKGNGQELNDINVNIAENEESVTFKFPEPLKEGSGTLSVTYTGELNDKMKGFYRNKYTTPDGEERFGATTQFEATDARRAFPCWDEPSVKATFDVTLVVPKNRVALSNMPITEEKEEGDLKVVSYERTPIMSTYLLAFVIGEYDYLEDKDSDGVLVRVYTPVGKKEQGRFALEVAVKTLPFYKDYFNIAYPLPKMDLIAIQDFAAGAMENWGLVTYRETALLIDPENSSSAAKQLVALVVGHEIAHQWFGNLVTMEWWTHLWLNEGFASWIEYLCVDHCFPEYDIWTQFASTDYTRALELDALNNSHPIEVPVGHPSEVDEIFDAISYSKGASVIRMLHNYIGDEDFRKGMHNYLNKHKYSNTFTEDLWAALGDASGKPVQEIMTSWTKQMGFPVLKVSQKVDGDKRHVTVTQEKFCSDGHQPGDGPLWMVPVSISTSSDPNKVAHTFTLDKKEMTVTMENVKADEWIKVNTGGVGFYRTSYEPDMLQQLLPAVRDRSLPPRDRLGLHSDLFALARAGVTSTADFLQVAEAYVNEENFTVWSDLSTNLGQLSTLLQYTDQHETYQKFVCKLFGPIAEKLGWDAKPDEGHLDALLRSVVIGKLGRNKHQPTIDEARARFAKHVDGSCHLVADLRGPVYSTVLSNGDGEVFESMLKLFRAADLHEERVRILRSLGSVQTEELIQKVLDFSLSDEVRSQDSVFVVTGVTGSVAGRDLAWKFIQDRWKELHERYTGGFLLARLIKRTTEDFATQDKAKEIETFFKQNSAPAAERTIQQSLEQIEINRRQLEKDSAAIKAFLEKNLS